MATANQDGAPSPLTRVEVLGNIGPNWFASVMGTGIVATAGATLPVHVLGLHAFADAVWVIAAVLLAVLLVVVGGPLAAPSHRGAQSRAQSADGPLLWGRADGIDDGRRGGGVGGQGPDR
jgi:Voltage-dependent anion channel